MPSRKLADTSTESLLKTRNLLRTVVLTVLVIVVLYVAIAGYFMLTRETGFQPVLGIGVVVICAGGLVPALIRLGAVKAELKRREQGEDRSRITS
ncbi:MAG: hypothetical protein EA425_11740 [Puniceicoccaceae bacterium]|nr:MAG: hypothetical protein EA425_11740 [Puniceicoccaceae bacterium]